MYRLHITETAEKQMRRLPADRLKSVTGRILSLQQEPRPRGVKKLVGGLGWRIRVGDYRVIFTVDDANSLVTVIAVKPRQSAY